MPRSLILPYTPWQGREIGVEIELTLERTTGASLTSAAVKRAVTNALIDVGAPATYLGQRAVGYYHSDGSTWDVKTDSTCGWEVASRALTLNEFGQNEELMRVCDRIGELNPVVNNQCGLHLHINARDLTWVQLQRLVWLWARYEPYWFSLVPEYRRQRMHCAPICTYDLDGQPVYAWQGARRMITGLRHAPNPDDWPRASLNLRPWWRSGRVEVRLHHGSIDYQEMRGWAMLMLALVERTRAETLPAVEAYEPFPRARAIDTAYIGAILGLTAQPNHTLIHPEARQLLSLIEARRQAFNPAPMPITRVDQREALARIRTLRQSMPAPGRSRRARRTGEAVFPATVAAEAERVLNIDAEVLDVTRAMTELLLRENRPRRPRRNR